MNLLRDFSNFIDDLPDYDPFEPAIIQLPEVEKHMSQLLAKLRDQIDIFRTAQRTIRARQIKPTSITQQQQQNSQTWRQFQDNDDNWCLVRMRRKHQYRSLKTLDDATAIVPTNIVNQPRIGREVDVPVSKNMSLRCIEISDISAIHSDGVLYYIPRIRRFAIRICGFILQGNIGTVYISETMPQKIHDCDAQANCKQALCNYYHNPLTCPGSNDIRNFAASSWIYRPQPSSDKQTHTFEKSSKKSRKLSSRPCLDDDIKFITSSDLMYYNEQLMHDILCGIIMNFYVRRDF
jgi:hypothetical protein